MNHRPRFRAHLIFTFAEHQADRRQTFLFDEKRYRRVPMSMDGVDGLHTVNMSVDHPGQFHKDDALDVDCRVLRPEGFKHVIKPSVRFRLWDGGFFADGIVTEVFAEERDFQTPP